MKWFKNVSIGSKLLIVFGVLCAMLIGLSAVAYTMIDAIEKNERGAADEAQAMELAAAQIRSDQNYVRAKMIQFITSSNPDERAQLKRVTDDRINALLVGIEQIKRYWTARHNVEGLTILAEVEKIQAAYLATRIEVIALVEAASKNEKGNEIAKTHEKTNSSDKGTDTSSGKADKARAIYTNVQSERFDKIRDHMLRVGDILHQNNEEAITESTRLFSEAVRIFVVITLVAILIALAMAWFMNRLLAVPLRVITTVAGQVASGDLTVQIEAEDRNDEIGEMQRSFVIMVNNLRGLNRDLREGFGVLSASSNEILSTVSQVAAGAAETATAVSQTSTTAEEVKQTAHVSHQKARNVQEGAQKTAAVSEAGRQAVTRTIEGMNHIRVQMESIAESVVRLSEQGQAIGEIIATVNDLAEQSNLLAVNAALEASRAGEVGKEFAVVAQEVKSLAEQSRQATTQVRVILMEVQKATSAAVMATEQGTKVVAAGVKQATEAGDSIRSLSESVTEAAQAATQIAASNQQQLVGMDQIALAIANIRQATGQSMSGTQQLKASAQNLRNFGDRLKGLIERQRVES